MSDANNNPLLGEDGYVAFTEVQETPVVTPAEIADAPPEGEQIDITPPVPDATEIVNTEDGGLENPPVVVTPEFVTKADYDKLLAVFESLLVRENLDIQLQHKYRSDAGLA